MEYKDFIKVLSLAGIADTIGKSHATVKRAILKKTENPSEEVKEEHCLSIADHLEERARILRQAS